MNINTKLMIALGILCIFVIISGVFGLVYTQSINEKLNVVTTTTTPLVETIDDMIITLHNMNRVVGEITSEKDPEQINALAKQLQALQKNFQKAETISLNLITEETLKEKLNSAVKRERSFYETAQSITSSFSRELKAEADSEVNEAINTLEEVSIRAYTSNKNANVESFKAVQATVFFLSLTTILSLLSALVIGMYLSRSLIRPINALSDVASKLSMGNFDVAVAEPASNDEIAHLTIVFNKMVKSLQKLVKESPGLKKYIDLSVQKRQIAEPEYKLNPKTIYLIKDRTPHRAYDIFSDKINKGMAGLCITRDDPELIKDKFHLAPTEWLWLTDNKDKTYPTTSNLQIILKKSADFTSKHSQSIVLLDRIDYLITKHSFPEVLKFLTTLNDQVMTANAITLIPMDPGYLHPQDLSLVEKELKDLPAPTEKEKIPEELMKILIFIQNRKKLNRVTSFKDISKEFQITAPTTKKKLKELHELHLIRIVKQGRNKLLEPTSEAERHV